MCRELHITAYERPFFSAVAFSLSVIFLIPLVLQEQDAGREPRPCYSVLGEAVVLSVARFAVSLTVPSHVLWQSLLSPFSFSLFSVASRVIDASIRR